MKYLKLFEIIEMENDLKMCFEDLFDLGVKVDIEPKRIMLKPYIGECLVRIMENDYMDLLPYKSFSYTPDIEDEVISSIGKASEFGYVFIKVCIYVDELEIFSQDRNNLGTRPKIALPFLCEPIEKLKSIKENQKLTGIYLYFKIKNDK